MRRAAAALLCMLCFACDGDSNQNDAGPPVDARFLGDASVQTCSADMNDCAELDFEIVCNLNLSRCVECITGADCSAPTSLGPTCSGEPGTCQCASDEECAGKVLGSYCHPTVSACGCINDEDCELDRECKLEPYLGTGIRTCQEPV